MYLETLVIVALLAASTAIAVGLFRQHRPPPASWLDDAMRRRLLVQTRDGQTIDGVITRVDVDGVEVSSPRVDGTALSGVCWVARERIAWFQRPEDPTG